MRDASPTLSSLPTLHGYVQLRFPVQVPNGAIRFQAYRVVASTGRVEEADYLKSLGANEIIDRSTLSSAGRPLAKERWAGVIDVTPDAVPVISALDQVPGLFLATGFSGHGFGIGPGAGRLIADLVVGDTPCVDPHPFRYQRLVDGSKIQLLH